MRIGQGFDVHRFGEERGEYLVRLGGIDVPSSYEVIAHSDGDVAIHALCDAMLGALALGDIGMHFPDTDPAYSGADSRVLLRHVVGLCRDEGYVLVNADITVIAERPKVSPHRDAMRSVLAEDLGVAVGVVSVKATTTEKLGFLGRGEGLAASAVVLMEPV